MKPIAAMSTAELAALAPLLRENIRRAQAGENMVLVYDLRRALNNVLAALKERQTRRAPHTLAEAAAH